VDLEARRQLHLERIALDLRRDGAEQSEADAPVIDRGRDYDRWTLARLLVPRLRVELKPDDVAAFRGMRTRRHL
jgi:hypothetical protein